MKIKTQIQAGVNGSSSDHDGKAASPGLKIKTHIKAGGGPVLPSLSQNHNERLVRVRQSLG